MEYLLAVFTVLAILSTVTGAFFALQFRKFLRPLIGLSAGMLIGVSFFDLMPESFSILGGFSLFTAAVLSGFLFYLILERFILFHACHEEQDSHHFHRHTGTLGLIGLTMHRAMDGFVIGLSFKSSPSLGLLVSLAIIAHSFPDGVNAVTLMLSKKQLEFKKWVALLAAAIIAGALLSQFVLLPQATLGLLIGFVAGWFLYLGASDLLPEAHKDNANLLPLFTTLIGLALIYIITLLLPAG